MNPQEALKLIRAKRDEQDALQLENQRIREAREQGLIAYFKPIHDFVSSLMDVEFLGHRYGEHTTMEPLRASIYRLTPKSVEFRGPLTNYYTEYRAEPGLNVAFEIVEEHKTVGAVKRSLTVERAIEEIASYLAKRTPSNAPLKAPESKPPAHRMVIELRGGVVQRVVSDLPTGLVDVKLLDWDDENSAGTEDRASYFAPLIKSLETLKNEHDL